MITQHDQTRLDVIDDDIENEKVTEYSGADMIWMRCLLREALKERDDALRRLAEQVIRTYEAENAATFLMRHELY